MTFPPLADPDAWPHLHAQPPSVWALALSVPSPRVEDVRREEGWTAIRMTRIPRMSAERVWAEVGREDRVRIVSVVGSVLREIGRIATGDGDGFATGFALGTFFLTARGSPSANLNVP